MVCSYVTNKRLDQPQWFEPASPKRDAPTFSQQSDTRSRQRAGSERSMNFTKAHAKLAGFALFGIGFLALALPAFAEPMTFWTGIFVGEYGYPSHELHHFVLGSVLGLLLLGVLVQAVRPSKRVGALHGTLIIWIALTASFSIAGEFSPVHLLLLGLLVGMAATHPVGTEQLPSRAQIDWAFVAVAVVTALGALSFGVIELNAHFARDDAHVAFDHYLFMATTGFSIAGLVLYSSVRHIGWRFPAYSAAFFMGVIGAASIVYPGASQGSSLGVVLGLIVLLWTGVFIVMAERGPELVTLFQGSDQASRDATKKI